ncbi:MAG: sensor domain-containing diguanylate cyclase, partial [Nitrospirota bacterium]
AAAEWRTTFDAVEDGIILTKSDGEILRCNEAARALFGRSFTDIIGRAPWEHLNLEGEVVLNCFNSMKESLSRQHAVLTIGKRWFSIDVDPILNGGGLIGGVFILSDITSQKETEEELRVAHEELKKLATTDKLTGAYNRTKFDEIIDIETERAKRYGSPLALIVFDIDHFKVVNDNYGHSAGDSVLKAIADIVRDNIRKPDYFVRWGGEEFMIISSDSSINKASALAERLRRTIEAHQFGEVGTVTMSFGVTEFRADETTAAFIARADGATYMAKKKGRNRVEAVR